ncbi:hypothetical protein Avbf_01751, partial [Armadillidium vulgare]
MALYPPSDAGVLVCLSFAGSHVDVGITMHILSISSLSEVQMKSYSAIEYVVIEGDPVVVGVTMHILSISSVSEVMMVQKPYQTSIPLLYLCGDHCNVIRSFLSILTSTGFHLCPLFRSLNTKYQKLENVL